MTLYLDLKGLYDMFYNNRSIYLFFFILFILSGCSSDVRFKVETASQEVETASQGEF